MFSGAGKVENGTRQGSVISPILFSVMIDGVFQKVGCEFGKVLFADDGAMWKKGKNKSMYKRKCRKQLKCWKTVYLNGV